MVVSGRFAEGTTPKPREQGDARIVQLLMARLQSLQQHLDYLTYMNVIDVIMVAPGTTQQQQQVGSSSC